jgi:type VI secretion system protein ImpF
MRSGRSSISACRLSRGHGVVTRGAGLERSIRQAIVDFEPRILPATLRVKAIEQTYLEHHNVIGVEISGQLWAQPVPLELLVRTEIDLETGRVEIAELTASRTR